VQGTLPRLMPVRRDPARFALMAPILSSWLVVGLLGCQPKVGDPCKKSFDCGLRVVRQCDVSNAPRDPKREGECIVENCSYGACPKEAVCVKVYSTELLSVSCEPDLEDVSSFEGLAGRDDCLPHEVCLPEGLCADEVRARTSCRRQCNRDSDCRDNYECVSTGAGGVYMTPDPADPTRQLTDSICVPR
jgi:hypothetical protein